VAGFFLHLGALGLVLLGIIDGPLFAPFGIDILLIVLVARHWDHVVWYVLAATAGSTIGYWIVYAIWRKGGEEGLRRRMKPGRFKRIQKNMERSAGKAIVIGALIPPPFPFTPIIAGAAAFQYPQKKLLPLLGAARGARFLLIALLAHRYGRHLIRIIESPGFRWAVGGLIALSTAGSAVVVYRWLRPGKSRPQAEPAHST
jgi:membrane protein YqaA with SNARE-associated domain